MAGTATEAVPVGASEDADGEQRPLRRRKSLRWAPPVLVLLLGLALAAAGWQLRARADRADLAGADPAAEARVVGQVEAALGRAFSYATDQDEGQRAAASAGLSGTAEEQHRRLSERLRGLTAGQRVSLTSRAVATGVIRLTADRAELLVLLDQSARRDDGPPALTGAQLRVTARVVEGRWLITELTSL